MEKVVTLKLSTGSLAEGFVVILQMMNEDGRPILEMPGTLPPAPELEYLCRQWQLSYRKLGIPYRLEAPKEGSITHVSVVEDCRALAQKLSQKFNLWLHSEPFRPLYDRLLEKLDPHNPARIIVQTSSLEVKRLPWHAWTLCDRYPKAEIALSAPTFERAHQISPPRQRVRILGILGNSEGIDIQADRALLNQLPDADVEFLVEPNRQQLSDRLWDPQGWDLLFFAGHSHTQSHTQTEATGHLWINQSECLTIAELKHALNKALSRGLNIAVFNSCDGLGLAQNLADLQIPQILVMQAPVPDRVAHAFLKAFLQAFARGELFYVAVREAREKLQGLEDTCPCASWLPTIYQNPALVPPVWATLVESPPPEALLPQSSPVMPFSWSRLWVACGLTLASILGARHLGVLQTWELRAYDTLMQLRPHEQADSRLLVVTVTEEDVQSQDPNQRRGSLSDAALSQVLTTLEAGAPRAIGLDIYRDFPVSEAQPALAEQLQSNRTLFAVCKVSETKNDILGISPPEEVPATRTGFSDFVVDADATIRRQLIGLTPAPASPCQARYSLSALLAMTYLDSYDIYPEITANGHLKIGDVVFRTLTPHIGAYQTIDTRGHQILLNYRNLPFPEDIAERVTLRQILGGEINPEVFRDRIIFIGTTAESFGDEWQTPFGGNSQTDRALGGVFMQAHMTSQMISAVLDDRPLIRFWPAMIDAYWISGWTFTGGLAIYIAKWSLPLKSYFKKLGIILLILEMSVLSVSWLALSILGYWLAWLPAAIAIVGGSGVMLALSSSRFHKEDPEEFMAPKPRANLN